MQLKLFLKKMNKHSFLQEGNRRPFHLFSLVILLISLNQTLWKPAPTQQETNWSIPQTIPGYDPETWTPFLVADQNRTVHAFTDQWVTASDGSSKRVILYNQWTYENGWTTPVDILLSPVKEARVTAVHLDENGTFHIVFFGGDNTGADMYYSQAPAQYAAEANAWSTPEIIGENAGDPAVSSIFEDDNGKLYVLYNGRQQGIGLYLVSSNDGGSNWSNPSPIFYANSDEPNISQLKVVKGRAGWFHAIWAVYSKDGQGRGIYYSRSQNGDQWSEPQLLAESQEGLGTQTPTIIQYGETLISIFNLPPKIYMRRSIDDGLTWSDPSILFPRHVGVNGSISTVIDGNDTLHMFFGQRISGNPDIHGMWHSIWMDDHWTEPEAVIRGPKVHDLEGSTSFDPYEANAVVSQGNDILVTWISDPGLKGNGVWYSYRILDAPEAPLNAIPTVVPQNATPLPTSQLPIPSPQATETTVVTTTQNPLFLQKEPSGFGIGLRVVLAVGVIFVVVVWAVRRKNH